MAVHTRMRRGKRRLIIDIYYRNPDGSQARFRRDAEVQTLAAARAEDRRRLAALVATGSPEALLRDGAFHATSSTPAKDELTFARVAQAYLQQYLPSQLKPSTRYGYQKVLEVKLIPRFGDKLASAISADDVLNLDVELEGRGLSASTRRNVQVVLRSVLCRFAVTRGFLSAPPRLPPLVKVGRRVLDIMTPEELEQLLQAAHPVYRRAFLVASFAGLRAGEIRGLRWRDVDLRLRRLVVRQSICRGIAAAPKSGHQRVVPLSPRLFGALEAVPVAERVGLACRNVHGAPLKEFTLRDAFRLTCERAKVSRYRFHDLRHFFVTALFRVGVAAPTVQALAGHSKLTTTQRYAHVVPADLENAIARL